MKTKTISAHYDTVFSIEHNNREFTPKNVDQSRIQNNYNLVNAGETVSSEFPEIKDLSSIWDDYRKLTQAYWRSYHAEQEELTMRIRATLRRKAKFQSELWKLFDYGDVSTGVAMIMILLLPLVLTLTVMSSAYTAAEIQKLKEERLRLYQEKTAFDLRKDALRNILKEKDRVAGTTLLREMDALVWKSEIIYEQQWKISARFATIEEIYQKVFEPGFQQFQEKQRKCRRYKGTYLEQIREKQAWQRKSKAKTEKIRATAEAIEIVFGIGDMDNTGYAAAPEDAEKSEVLLKDFCQHLLSLPNVCTVTTHELNDPAWKPPFKHGLILVNLVGHFDEATPGIHATFIPYSRGCKRGPDAQASLGRAFAGMGYPSTWKDMLDSNGNPILKTDRYGKAVLNEDGSVRTKKEPDKQGIIDWIEEQKNWVQNEMYRRYEWEREYKGSHPRGNLSVPDYKVARAQERIAEAEQRMKVLIQEYLIRCNRIAKGLHQSIEESLAHDDELRIIFNYIQNCSDARYEELWREAVEEMETLSIKERRVAEQTLHELLNAAENKKNQSYAANQKNESKTSNREL